MSILKLKATIKTYVQKIADIYKHGYDYDVSVHVLLFVQGILIELFIYNLENCDMLLDISIPFFQMKRTQLKRYKEWIALKVRDKEPSKKDTKNGLL